jgi:uncharacterized protein YndB with AHSA1/START domain
MEINRNAPIVGSTEILVSAPIETVWDLLSDIDGWPRWNPAISEAHLEGQLGPDSTFQWKAGPGGITSTLREVSPPHTLAWTGKTFGINAVHVYRLLDTGGATRVHTAESWEGLPARLMKGRMQKTLDENLERGLEALKREAETRASG